jgi:glycosyltransferase involved in cell wall biosynthesis
MPAPKVTVVSAFFNAAPFLGEAVQSVLDQGFDDWELLLVDDGSTDASSAVADWLASEHPGRIRRLEHSGQENRGAAASRNLGIAEARGELLAFIDADDRWRPNKLAEQIACFTQHPDVDAVFGAVNYWSSWNGGADRVVPSGHRWNQPVRPPEALLANYPLGSGGAPCPSDMMIKRSVAAALGGFEESFTGPLQLYEDQAFFAKLFLASTVYFDERVWLDYRLHDNSCVARVTRQGGYAQVRQHYLRWLHAYVGSTAFSNHPELQEALSRADRAQRQGPLVRYAVRAKSKLRQAFAR